MITKKKYNTRPKSKMSMSLRDFVTNVEALTYDEQFVENAINWAAFWRKYPFHMCKHYLGINLKPFQCVILYQMFNNSNSVYIASRGQGKTFLTAIACVCYAILYPDSQIVIASGVKSQAFEIFVKIDKLYKDCPMLRQEILYKTEGKDNPRIEFKNGSKIITVASNDNARGKNIMLPFVTK